MSITCARSGMRFRRSVLGRRRYDGRKDANSRSAFSTWAGHVTGQLPDPRCGGVGDGRTMLIPTSGSDQSP